MSRERCPCEIIVWYILPVIRKEFARMMVEDYNLSQKEVADKLGLTEPAISQYLSSKRGSDIELSPKILEEIRKVAKDLANPKTSDQKVMGKICKLCAIIKSSGTLEEIDSNSQKSKAKCSCAKKKK
jgi:uncharacterized protein